MCDQFGRSSKQDSIRQCKDKFVYSLVMNPAGIKQTLHAAKLLNEGHPSGTPEGFLLSYVAWEGLKNRILVCGLSQQGWQLNTFKNAIEGQKFWRPEKYDRAFTSVFGKPPQQTTRLGQIWREANKADNLRGKFVHGMGQSSPERMLASYSFLLATIKDLTWLSNLYVLLPNGEKDPLKDIFKPLRAAQNLQPDQSVIDLQEQLGLSEAKLAKLAL